MLAGLPKAPSSFNPVVNPKRAKQRQLYVLRRMHELGYLNDAQFAAAQKDPLVVRRDIDGFAVHAEYVAEMVRQVLYERHPEDVYTRGFRVYTTITKRDQEAAYDAMRRGVLEYDRRHGYRGPEGYVDLPKDAPDEPLEEVLQEFPDSDDLLAAVVLEANPKQVKAYRRGGEIVTITEAGLRFAASSLAEKTPPNRRIRRGAVIRIQKDEKLGWQILQIPDVEAAFVALDPQTGAVRALVGGFDFTRNKYNHVTQAWRQPGSSFKPFIYSASLEKGFTAATIVNDAPVVVDAALTGGQVWEPKNYDGKYEGPMRLRMALAKSKNMVSVRVLQSIGTQYAQDYVTRFGFDADKHPPYLTLALGAGSVTPWQMSRAYAVFANGGYRIDPYLIEKIVDDRGNLLAQAQPVKAGDPTLRVDRRAQRVHHGQHDARRRTHRHRGARGVARAEGSCRQDRHDQRPRRCVVRRLSAGAGRHRLDRVRPAEEARQRTRPAARRRCRSGWATCGPRSRACRRCSPSRRPAWSACGSTPRPACSRPTASSPSTSIASSCRRPTAPRRPNAAPRAPSRKSATSCSSPARGRLGRRPLQIPAYAPCMIPSAVMRRIVALLLIAFGLAACGTKGALYLPPPEGQDVVTKKK